MPFFAIFIFGAVILGAGVMLSPAWPTPQPRIGLAGTLALALVVGGTIFWASLFGWNTLVIDYLLFALVVGIFLGGTLSIGQSRAESRGEELEDKDQGWTGPQDLAFFAAVAVIFTVAVMVLPVPYGTDGATYGYLTLVTREGLTLDTFAPFHPDASFYYPPGFIALTAYLSQQLNLGIQAVQFGTGAVLALLNIWLAYDLGAEIRDKRLGRMMALAMFGSLGVLGMLVNGQYAGLLGLAFTQAFLIYTVRYLTYRYPVDVIGAGLLLGAVVISSPDMTVVVALGFLPWLATIWLSQPAPAQRTWVVMAAGIPLVAVLAISPWLFTLNGVPDADFARDVENLTVLLQYHGVWIVPVALLGLWLGWQRRDAIVILCIGWLLLILDFAVTGGIVAVLPFLTNYADPQAVAWYGPVIPYSILGGMGLLWLWDTQVVPRVGEISYRQAYAISTVAIALAALLFALREPVMAALEQPLAGEADIAALRWLRDNTDPDARLLNHPATGLWASVVAERDSVYVPLPPYTRNTGDILAEQEDFLPFWEESAALDDANITHIVVPQGVETRVTVEAVLVFDQNDISIYELQGD